MNARNIYQQPHTNSSKKKEKKKTKRRHYLEKKKKDLVYPRIKKYKIFLFKEFIELTKRR